jgi:GNAT superfamily N-acetyltransferase
MEEATFEQMRPEDAAGVALLAAQLGYPCAAEEVASRIALLAKDQAEQLRVARLGAKVAGWIHFQLRNSLTAGPRVEISQVVVDEAVRGKGIGANLCRLAEQWGRAQGLARIRLASQIKRTDTHRFYLNLGYTIDKTSHIFVKAL